MSEPGVSVATLLSEAAGSPDLELTILAGDAGLGRRVTNLHVQKTGLALAGFDELLRPGRILVFGQSEMRYLQALDPNVRRASIRRVFDRGIPCVVVTDAYAPSAELVDEADRAGIPVLQTPLATPIAIARMTVRLETHLAVRGMVHGVLLDILGLGVLVVGESGIGKSECALDLVVRGHRLVADDTVEIRRRADTVLLGSCPELTRHHMEIRGLGVINIRDLFGVASTRSSKRIELVVQLERWETGREYDRLGLDEERFEILGVPVPMIRMPVAPGRNVAILVEVAARNQLLRARGHHAARALAARLDRALLNDSATALEDPTPFGAAAPAAAGRLDGAEDEAERGDEDDA
jgi:HPr kinase/phosphorylase